MIDESIRISVCFLSGQPTRVLADSTASNLIRSSSYESIHQTREPDEQKRSIKSRHRACNDSFRQAVDKSYGQNNHHGERRNLFPIFFTHR